MVETVVAIALIGLGVSITIAALTKFNAFASTSRNATGAYAAVMSEVDAIQSATPFNPQAGQVPDVLALGVHPAVPVQIYQYYDDKSGKNVSVVPGTGTSTVEDVSTPGAVMYRATVTVSWQYPPQDPLIPPAQQRRCGPIWNPTANRWEYQFSMSTLRASDK